jgi:prevent-host-death family protein
MKPSRVLKTRAREKPATATAALAGSSSVPATEAKNRFGEMVKRARQGKPVFIERHGQPQVVLIGYDAYRGLVAEKRGPDEKNLHALRAQFDELCANMQKPAARKVADRFLNASAAELNRAARRGRGG